jgi:hypothetical protein
MESETPQVVSTAAEITRGASLMLHIRENNIAYLLGVLISYQMGILDKVLAHGSGICS